MFMWQAATSCHKEKHSNVVKLNYEIPKGSVLGPSPVLHVHLAYQ